MLFSKNRIARVVNFVLFSILISSPLQAFSIQDEIKLGKDINTEILKKTPVSKSKQSLNDIEKLGLSISQNVKRKEIPYHFTVLQDDDLNAFAVPGGYIYFTQRLWDTLRYDERAGVLAHEITHVDQRHSIDALLKHQRRRIWTGVLLSVFGAGDWAFNAADIVNTLHEYRYSRGDERQADEGGVELLENAKLNPAGLLLSLRKIKRFEDESGSKQPKIFMSHPPTKERLDYLTQLLKKDGIPIPEEHVGEAKYKESIGTVASVSENTFTFNSSVNLNVGTVIWLMRKGWDKYYENRALIPYARAVVQKTGKEYQAKYTMLKNMNKSLVKQGSLIYLSNSLSTSSASIKSDVDFSIKNDKPYFDNSKSVNMYSRYLAYHVVWNDKTNTSDIEPFLYITILDNTKPTGYICVSRPGYQYVIFDSSTIIKTIEDPDKDIWMGTISNVDKSTKRISINLKSELVANKKYALVAPGWNNDDMESRIICSLSADNYQKTKGIMLNDFTQGFTIDDVKIGYDIYEVK